MLCKIFARRNAGLSCHLRLAGRPYPYVWVFICSIVWTGVSEGQNLIPNSGFDEYTECPSAVQQIFLVFPWTTVTNGTPDFFHECSDAPRIKVPNAGRSIYSYQEARSGGGYAGIMVYSTDNSKPVVEYMGTPLIEPMRAGILYYIEFYVSPDLTPYDVYWKYTDAVGLALTSSPYYEELAPQQTLSLEPVIENRDMLITDTVGWTRVSGCYRAKGDERFAIIGNFRSTEETLLYTENPNIYPIGNYFYIEDVSIIPYDPLPDSLFICAGESIVLEVMFPSDHYLWSTGETGPVLWVASPGVYWVEVETDNCILSDTMRVYGTEPGPWPVDTAICEGELLQIRAPLAGSVLWMDGSIDPHRVIHTPGFYGVTVTNPCGMFSFETEVSIVRCGCDVYVPNVFSPNNDGVNDILVPQIRCDDDISGMRFIVYDRWGRVVYQSAHHDSMSWDGTDRGRLLPGGVYVWMLEIETLTAMEKSERIFSGDITLIR